MGGFWRYWHTGPCALGLDGETPSRYARYTCTENTFPWHSQTGKRPRKIAVIMTIGGCQPNAAFLAKGHVLEWTRRSLWGRSGDRVTAYAAKR